MFSSLPSASKIYVSSSKPRQKSAASSRRRKKRSHNSSSGLTDSTLVSLIDHDFDQGKSSSENFNDFRIKANRTVFSEDSEILDDSSEGLYVEDFPTESSVLEDAHFDDANLNVAQDDKEVGLFEIDANFNECFTVKDVCISENSPVDNLNSPSVCVNLPVVSLEHNTEIFDLEGCSQNAMSDAVKDLSDMIGHSESTTGGDTDAIKYVSKSTITENTQGIFKSSSPDCVNEEGSGDHLSFVLTETKHLDTKDISKSSSTDCINADSLGGHLTLDLTETKHPDSKVSFDNATESDNPAVPISHISKEQGNLSALDQEMFLTAHSTQLSLHLGDDCQEKARSPEHSDLSCTESVSYESKSSESEKVEKSVDDVRPSDVCRSYSDLGSVKVLEFKRCSSFPNSLEETKRINCTDKGTTTSYFPCRNCGSVEGMAEERVELDRPVLTSRGVLAKFEEDVSKNMLPPLTTAHARARSYVFGSTGHTGSLLGSDELNRFFPDNHVTIFVGTWNMNSHSPPKNIDDFLLPLDIEVLPDIYAIGVQEGMQSRFEWEVLVQSTLGPSHVLFASSSLGVLHLSVFMRRDLVWFCSEPEDASVATRPGTMVKTKGAVAVSFTFFGTSLLFLNSHLAAHEQKLKERLLDYEKICSTLDLPKSAPLKSKDKDVTSRFDVVLWCGDLNFRVERDRPSVLSFVERRLCTARPSCSFLVKHDQLYRAMKEGSAFAGFKEGVIHFNPSYKFEVGTNSFTSARLRVPSYTDRILFRVKEGRSSVSCLHYDAAPAISTSDHKPVFGVYRAALRPGRDNVPLAAGMFKRDVYLEALKRRSQFVGAIPQGQSAVCTLM